MSADELQIEQIHQDYISGWLEGDEEKILGLFEEQSRLQPSTLPPIEGKLKIREFWFPNDSSVTTINQFDTEILSIEILDTLATLNYSSILDWTYKKGESEFGKTQSAINTFVCRKQQDKSWKIWRAMWTDVWSTPH